MSGFGVTTEVETRASNQFYSVTFGILMPTASLA